jgi:hypothetical protein
MGQNPTALRSARSIQLPLLVPPRASQLASLEPTATEDDRQGIRTGAAKNV